MLSLVLRDALVLSLALVLWDMLALVLWDVLTLSLALWDALTLWDMLSLAL